MEIQVLLFLVFLPLNVLSQGTWYWLNIDCGSEISYDDGNGLEWKTDEDFISTGKNKMVSNGNYNTLERLNTLRVFTTQNKNCYSLPTTTSTRHFIRAMFHYGNYDGLSKPPTFDIEFDGNKWATVVTSLNDYIYYELMYANKADNISVCLARTRDNQFPFISSLELWPVDDDMYAGMSRDLAWHKSYRYNYGGNDWILGYSGDDYNRIWEPITPPGLNPVTAGFNYVNDITAEEPPSSVIVQAVEAPNSTDKISLSFNFTKTDHLNRILMYYTEMVSDYNETRSFDIYVNDKFKLTTSPEYQNCTLSQVSTQSGGTLNVELRPTANSTLPPSISAIEVYTASDPLVTIGTSEDDLDGLASLVSSFEQLEGWSGDPCLPNNTVWQWLGCTGNDPPRVTSLYLSGYGLDGPLPDFSQMEAMETIDLADNSLDGPIPDFLGNLPHLRFLNLSENNFSGKIPESLTKSKNIKYDLKDNPHLHHPKRKRRALVIGLAVGIPLGLTAVIFALVYFLTRRKPTPSPTKTEAKTKAPARPTGENFPVGNAGKTDQAPLGNGQTMPVSTGEHIPVRSGSGRINHPLEVPISDREELYELIKQHSNNGAPGRA